MMANPTDMTTPVTRGELREELAQLEIRLEQKLEEKLDQKLEQKLEEKLDRMLDQKLQQRLAHLATKADLEIWGGALLARIQTDLARHTKAIQEALSAQVSALDDKYTDLPRRVSRLEAAVFKPKRR